MSSQTTDADSDFLAEVHPAQNAESIAREIAWFSDVVHMSLRAYVSAEPFEITPARQQVWRERLLRRTALGEKSVSEPLLVRDENAGAILPPDLTDDHSVYAQFVKYYGFGTDERLVIMLALIPHVQPQALDRFLTANRSLHRGHTEFGGIKGSQHAGFIPTIQTALFLLAGGDLNRRFELHRMFEPDHPFSVHGILRFDHGKPSEPFQSSVLSLADEYVDFFTIGVQRKPHFSMEFPAKLVTTELSWEDLVVDDFTARQLEEIRTWLQHGQRLLDEWGMRRIAKGGYKALFYGPPGTGKTLAVTLLGKSFNRDVYRIDLSMVVSKYIGETEKNLAQVFRKAENKNWILFFDEADAMFGSRTKIVDAHDKYANQEISYLLQRLEDFAGLVILASNMRSNVDDAFIRRMNAIISFSKPQPLERFRIWRNAFSVESQPPSDEELTRIAERFELTGGAIVNAVHFASLEAISRNDRVITVHSLEEAAKRELRKERRT